MMVARVSGVADALSGGGYLAWTEPLSVELDRRTACRGTLDMHIQLLQTLDQVLDGPLAHACASIQHKLAPPSNCHCSSEWPAGTNNIRGSQLERCSRNVSMKGQEAWSATTTTSGLMFYASQGRGLQTSSKLTRHHP